MIEIKFRAWFDSIGKYLYFKDVWVLSDEVRKPLNELESFFSQLAYIGGKRTVDDYPYTLEQYTGLKDKNGKEIYDGDIIHVDKFFIDYRGYEPEVLRVAWDDSRSGFSIIVTHAPLGHEEYYFSDIELDNTAVIGNIHENPELL